MLLQSLRALYLAPAGPRSIWKYLEALVRLAGVSRRFVCSFQTDLHFADGMRRKKHRKPTMDQRRMWRIEGIVLETVKIGQYISDM